MGNFAEALAGLNGAQRRAVEQIDGPVMVVAGPGTGKTQLLSVRVGQILQREAGMLPSNILCLTFTDAAAANLRERLVSKIGLGQDAYRVAIHTFNSFGSWIMSTYPEYFFDWREAATADELATHRILEELLRALQGDALLAAQGADGSFFALKRVRHFISDSKRANLRPADIRAVLDANEQAFAVLGPVINEHWPSGQRGAAAAEASARCLQHLRTAAKSLETAPAANLTPFAALFLQELQAAAAESETLAGAAKTKPFTAWKNRWLELDDARQLVFKAAKATPQLRAAADIYEGYQAALAGQGLVDFDDQIMTVLRALEANEALRLNLQERFQYIMIDEYQDTNRAQLQMARLLTNADVHEGRPNILVVGDDDQAIYRFQGADMSNIGAFAAAYQGPIIIALTDNYRSNAAVLGAARRVSAQIELSLEKQSGMSKALTVHVETTGAGAQLHEFTHEAEHYAWIADEIKRQREAGQTDIAVLARERTQLDALVPYLRTRGLPVDYERRENVLEQPQIVALITLARLVQALSEDELETANALLPEVLSHPMWQIAPADMWQIAREARTDGRLWFDIIFEQENTPARSVADFLLQLSQQALTLPFERVFDMLIGLSDEHTEADEFISPFKKYYFGQELSERKPAMYLTLLSHLDCLRRHVRAAQQSAANIMHLKDFVAFVDAWQRAGLTMIDTAAYRETPGAVRLMTAHKAKGQEFDTVFIIGLEDKVWNKSASSSRFSYPPNLAEIKPSDNDADDALRLLFVAMTRAKQTLHLCYFKQSDNRSVQAPFAPLLATALTPDTPTAEQDTQSLAEQYEARWTARHLSVDKTTKQTVLAPLLETYTLSATHLTSFLDVSRGGPSYFLTHHLLGFPQAASATASFGIAVHRTLRRAHELAANGVAPDITQLIGHFKAELVQQPLSAHELAQFTRRGDEALRAYFTHSLAGFSDQQKAEVDFAHEGVCWDKARLKGVLDRIDFDAQRKVVDISDYKTGHAYSKWQLPPSAKDFERIKLRHYRQQLLFYELLVRGANSWGKRGWQVGQSSLRFVEPDPYGHIRSLVLDADSYEQERLGELVQAVWAKIMAADFPDTSRYTPDVVGIEQFETDLLTGNV